MATRRPLVLVNGQLSEMPSGDTIDTTIAPGAAGSSGNPYSSYVISADFTVPTNNSMEVPQEYQITGTASLILAGTAIFKIT